MLSRAAGERLAFNPAPLDRWIAGPPVPVTQMILDAYADAVDAPPGPWSAPLFSVIACYPILFRAVDAVTPAPARARLVHGEHDITVHRLVSAGQVLTARARPRAVASSSAGARVQVELEVRDETFELIATHLLTAVARGITPERDLGTVPGPWMVAFPPASVPVLDAVAVPVATDQPRRYADATGDRNPVHLDAEAARSVGLPGVIAHGLGVLGLVTSALVRTFCADDASRLARVRARFSAPVIPGDVLVLRPHADGWTAATMAFSVDGPAGVAVLRDGRVQLR